MTEQLKAEAYVREQRPALMELRIGTKVRLGQLTEDIFDYAYFCMSVSDELGLLSNGEEYKLEWLEKRVIGHPPNLQDWLAVLRNHCEQINYVQLNGTDYITFMPNKHPYKTMLFNLTTGQPATEADYKAFNETVK